MRIGILYDLFEDYPWQPGEPTDADAENEPATTVEAIGNAVRILGHDPVLLGSPMDLLKRIETVEVDMAINIAEAAHSRNREAYAPILLEMLGIPFIGSDALTLSISLDKAATKDLAVAAGLKTPAYAIFSSSEAISESDLPSPFPLFVKPRYEGSAKGIGPDSKVHDISTLRKQVGAITQKYRQDALVEAFIEGAEFTVALIGNDPVEVLPVMQRAVEAESGIGLHALDRRGLPDGSWDHRLPGELTPDLEQRLQEDAVAIFNKLECRDFARVDFRVDPGGDVWFLEINPLPTFATDGTFAILAEMDGQAYEPFLAGILEKAFKRFS